MRTNLPFYPYVTTGVSAAPELHATSMAADESNRPRAVKVGGDDGHERKIFSYRASGFTKRSAARRHDRFPRGRRGSTDLPDGAGIRCIASGRHGCGQPSRDGGLCFARASTRIGKPSAGHVTTNSDGAGYYVGAAIENPIKRGPPDRDFRNQSSTTGR